MIVSRVSDSHSITFQGEIIVADNTALLEKIRKILARTEESGCTESEAQSAFAHASRLMTEHNLTNADINIGSVEAAWMQGEAVRTGRVSLEMNAAINVIKTYFFVDCYIDRGAGRQFVVKFFGKPENVETAVWTFNALLAACDRLFDDYKHRTRCPQRDRRAFTIGCINGFSSKLKSERDDIERERDASAPIAIGSDGAAARVSGGTSLALRDIAQEIKTAMHEAVPTLKTRPTTFRGVRDSGGAGRAGYEAGKALRLNRGIGGHDRKRIG